MAKMKRSRRVRVAVLVSVVLVAGVAELAPTSVFALDTTVLPLDAADDLWLDAPASFGDPMFLDAPQTAEPSEDFLDPAAEEPPGCDRLAPKAESGGCSAPDPVADTVDDVLEQLLTP